MKRNGAKVLAKTYRAKTARQKVANRSKVRTSAKDQERRVARGRRALKKALEIGASFKADADTWKRIAEDKEIEYL